MKCSVVIPVRDGALYLAACLDSVLAGTRQPDEIVVVDDGSRDASAHIASRYSQVRLVSTQPAGTGAARNCGVELAVGEWIAFLDADDLQMPHRLEVQAAYLQARPELDGVFGEVEQFSDPPGAFVCDSRRQAARLPGTLLVKRELLVRTGGFNPRYRAGEFIDWALRAEEAGGAFASQPELVLRRRLHANNGGRGQPEARQDYARVVMAALRRRRGQ